MNEVLVIWALVGVSIVGLSYTTWNLRDARRDQRALDEAQLNGVLLIVTTSNLGRERRRFGFWALSLGLGLAALFDVVSSEILVWVIIVAWALQAWNSYADRQERIRVRAERAKQ